MYNSKVFTGAAFPFSVFLCDARECVSNGFRAVFSPCDNDRIPNNVLYRVSQPAGGPYPIFRPVFPAVAAKCGVTRISVDGNKYVLTSLFIYASRLLWLSV